MPHPVTRTPRMRRGPNRWFFDLWSRVYDLPVVQWAVYRPVHDAVVTALRRHATRAALDVGCGTGLLTARLQRELSRTHVVGCDFSHGMLEHALGRSIAVDWVQGDAMALPFRAASFDAVLSTEAFHWFPDQRAALREFFRVLVPGGRLLIAMVNPSFELLSRVTSAGSRLVGEPLYWPTRQQLRARLEAAGFAVETQRRLFRLTAGLTLPPVLTIAVRPA